MKSLSLHNGKETKSITNKLTLNFCNLDASRARESHILVKKYPIHNFCFAVGIGYLY